MFNPLASLGHHWQDSSHISFGVLTAGVFTRSAKLEGSWFNGREPDERRWDLDLRRPDSYAARLTVNPTAGLSAQASYGHLASPEALHPDESVNRITASANYVVPLDGERVWAATAVFGRNQAHGSGTNTYLVEASSGLTPTDVLFARGELLEKSGADLVLSPDLQGTVFNLGALSAGYTHSFGPYASLLPGVGVCGTINFVPNSLRPFYGSRTPVGGIVYLRVGVASGPRMMGM